MSRFTRVAVALLALLATATLAPAAPAPEDNSPLAIVPASAPIVVYVHGVEATKGRLIATIKKALPEYADQVEGFLNKAWTDGTPDGRKLRGLVKNGPAFVVFTELPKPSGEEPNIAIIVAVTKYSEFRDNLLTEEERKSIKADPAGYETASVSDGKTAYFIDKKEFAVVTPVKEVAESFTKKHRGLDGHISKEQAARLLAGDVGVYVSMDALNKEYAEQIKLAKEAARDGLKTVADAVDQSQRGIFVFLQKIVDPAFQAVEDSQGLLVTVEFRPGGFALHCETELRAGTPTAKSLEGNKLAAFKGMDDLPSGELIYFGVESNKWITSAVNSLAYGSTIDADSKEGKALQASLDELLSADPGTSLGAYSVPMQGVQFAHYADPAKAIEAQLKLLRALGSGSAYNSGLLKDKPKVTPKAQKYGEFEFTSVELKWDFEKMAAGAGGAGATLPDEAKKQLAEGFKKLMGESRTVWLGTDGKVVLQVTAKDWAAAEKLLKSHSRESGTAAALAAFRDTRKELPAEASVVGLVDLVRYVGVMLEFAKPIIESTVPLPFKLPTAPADLPATYSGAAITLKSSRAGLDVFISAPTVHEFYNAYVAPLLGAAGGAAS